MRIGLFHTRAGRRHSGGKAVFVRKLATALATDHEVSLYTQRDRSGTVTDRLTEAGVRVVPLPTGGGSLAWSVFGRTLPLARDPLVPLIRSVADGVTADIDTNVDVLATHRFLEDLVLSNLVDVPVVYQYHNVTQVGAGARVREWATGATVHLANSATIAEEAEWKLGRVVDGIVSPGVDTTQFHPDAGDGRFDDRETVLFVGRVVPAKGVFDLLDALGRMGDPPRLVVVGNGDLDAARERAAESGVAEQVDIRGEVDHDALAGYYADADVVCNPTHYEGFGMVNLEAMACGTPVVTTDIPAVAEYANDGDNAVVVPPGDPRALADALVSLLGDHERKERVGHAGVETAQTYSWDRQATRFVDCCRQSLDR